MLSTYVIGLIRTWTPIAIGAALTWLLRHTGVLIDAQTSAGLTIFVVALVSGLYYALIHGIELAFPAAGRVLLALGLTAAQPSYAAVRADGDGTYRPFRA